MSWEKWKEANLEHAKELENEWREKHSEYLREYQRLYKLRNREKLLMQKKTYYHNTKSKWNVYDRLRNKLDKKRIEYNILYQSDYKKRNKERLAERERDRVRKNRIMVLSHYGGSPPKCSCCGESTLDFLTLDHLKDRRSCNMTEIAERFSAYGSALYRRIIKLGFPEEYRILCYNCNAARSLPKNQGRCPHEVNKLCQRTQEL